MTSRSQKTPKNDKLQRVVTTDRPQEVFVRRSGVGVDLRDDDSMTTTTRLLRQLRREEQREEGRTEKERPTTAENDPTTRREREFYFYDSTMTEGAIFDDTRQRHAPTRQQLCQRMISPSYDLRYDLSPARSMTIYRGAHLG